MRRLGTALLWLAVYVTAVVWLTWPLADYLTSHIGAPNTVARFDALYAAWAMAWGTHALTTAPLRFFEANIYHPTAHALFYGPTEIGALPWFLPTFLVSGNPALALNLMVLASLALTAWTLHLVVVAFVGSHAAGFVAASAILTDRWFLWLAPTAPNYTVLQWWPLVILLAARPATRLRVLVPVLLLQALIDPIYVAVDLLVPLGLLALGRLARPATRGAGLRLAIGLAIVVLCLAPLYLGWAAVRAGSPDWANQTVHRHIPWVAITAWRGFLNTPASIAGAALLLVPLGLVAAAHGRPTGLRGGIWSHGALWAVTGVILGLPAILPRATLPIFSPDVLSTLALRVPARLTIGAMFGLALLAAAGFAACIRPLAGPGPRPVLRALGRGAAALAVVTVVYAEYCGYPLHPSFSLGPVPAAYPLLAVEQPDPDLMQKIRETPGALVELPLGFENTYHTLHAQAMYRSIYHWRPILNGYSSYWPARFRARMALAARLPDADAIAALRAETGMTMVLVRWALLTPIEQGRWVHIAAGVARSDLRPVMWKNDGLLFVVRDDVPATPPPAPAP